jgi:putative ABC transport system permease protein
MFNNYLRFCLKSIKQKKSNSFFIISGTAITAATVVLLLGLLMSKKNPNSVLIDTDRMLVLESSLRTNNQNNWNSGLNFRLIKEHIEPVENIVEATIYTSSRIQHWVNEERIESRLLFADHRFTKFFNLNFIEGSYFTENDYNAESKVIVISERSAKLFFGNESAIGKSIENQKGRFTVIGVYENVPQIPYMSLPGSFDEIIPLTHDDIKDRETSIDESSYDYYSLLRVNSVENIDRVKLDISENIKTFEVRPEELTLYLRPFIADEYLYSKIRMPTKDYLVNSSSYQFYMTSLLLMIVLTIICLVNISNLTMTTMINRNIEFGVRYAFGANRFDIIKQGVIESMLFGFFSFLFSLMIAKFYFYMLNSLNYTKNLYYSFDSILILVLLSFSILIPFISYVLAIYRINDKMPVSLLKGNI